MNKLYLLLLLLFALPSFGQNVVVTVPNATIAVCGHPANAVPCTNYATTFTDSTMTTSCPNNAQIVAAGTTTCTSVSDSFGNFGFWTPPGCYDYTVTTPANQSAGPYYACNSQTNPILVSAGLSGDTSFNALQIAEAQSGEADFNWLKRDGTSNYQWFSFYPWFTFPAQNQGWYDFKISATFFEYVGGMVMLGRGTNYPLIDPGVGPTITHAGGTGAGVHYSLSFIDANAGMSMFSPIGTDATGFPSPDVSHTNTLCWMQPGGYSEVIVSRGTDPTQVLDAHNSALLSVINAGESSTPTCFTDSGQYSVVALSSIGGAFYTTPARNSTSSGVYSGRIWGQGSMNMAGGIDSRGSIVTVPEDNPGAPGVVVNAGSGTTTYYAVVFKDYLGALTLPSPSTMVSGGATPNNTVSWDCYPAYTSVDVIVSTDNATWLSLTGSTNLPCEGSNYPAGNPVAATFTDTGQTRSTYFVSTRNQTGDINAFGNLIAHPDYGGGLVEGTTVLGTSNVTGALVFGFDNNPAHGYSVLGSGDATHTGYAAWYNPSGVRTWTLGGDSTSNLTLTPSGAYTFNVAASLAVGGVTVAAGGIVDAGTLGATTAVAPAAALGTGSPGAGTALFGDQTYKKTPTVATPTAGFVACIKSAGPPVLIGTCTALNASTGACSACN